MNEVILVALCKPETAHCLLTAARRIADRLAHARIEALAVRMPAVALVLPTEQLLTNALRKRWEVRETERVEQIRHAYQQWAAPIESDRCACNWVDVEGIPEQEVAVRGKRADLLIIDRPAKHPDEACRETVRAAIFECHRPVLLVPPNWTVPLGRHPAIAWRDDGRAIKAVIPAMRYFAGAEAISVLVGYRGDAKPGGIPVALAEHGVEATVYALPIEAGPFGKQLLAKAAELKADLLVAGAYVHSPLREMLLGGVTRYVLAHAEIPVFMRH